MHKYWFITSLQNFILQNWDTYRSLCEHVSFLWSKYLEVESLGRFNFIRSCQAFLYRNRISTRHVATQDKHVAQTSLQLGVVLAVCSGQQDISESVIWLLCPLCHSLLPDGIWQQPSRDNIIIAWPQRVSLWVEISTWRKIKSSIMIGDILG